jgi:hypothetical protein
MSDLDFRRMADYDFQKARSKQLFKRLVSLLQGQKDDMLSFHDVRTILRPRSESYLGMRTVPLSRIVGSEGRYRDFNRSFLPRSQHLKSRWTNVTLAHYRQVNLPAIKLYEIGGVYFVRDGNHRVSVARSRGVEFIDAEVVSLNAEIKLEPGDTDEDLRRKVLEFERRRFFESTHLDKLRPGCELEFTATGRYDEIVMHINGHKYFVNQDKEYEIPFEQGMLSWYDTVYLPIVQIIQEHNVLQRFPGRTAADLYVWTVRHWDELKRRYGPRYQMRDAILDFSRRYGQGFWDRVRKTLSALFGRKPPR